MADPASIIQDNVFPLRTDSLGAPLDEDSALSGDDRLQIESGTVNWLTHEREPPGAPGTTGTTDDTMPLRFCAHIFLETHSQHHGQ
ncbi:hypothetical protein I6E74_09570 [Salinibacterium sp. SWN139]|uniref:hypothetical protein n=1 Tax=Salinibacterium sp. SWN139 TaxID=2792055 RepID=UPI0018CED8CB|nr:hypothetical protein [Salinibacterium sp. SWN139]MBH0054417.1 hypothetical protein [Salinibacterium sp. SWN139]